MSMNKAVKMAASRTEVDAAYLKGLENPLARPSLKDAAIMVRRFLVHFKDQISAWKPWLKFAVSAVIVILDMLISGEEA